MIRRGAADVGITKQSYDEVRRQDPATAYRDEVGQLGYMLRYEHRSPVIECGNIRRWIAQQKISSSDEDIRSATRGEKWAVDVIAISMPVVSLDGHKAGLIVNEAAGPLAGAKTYVAYRRSGDDWKFVFQHVLSIS